MTHVIAEPGRRPAPGRALATDTLMREALRDGHGRVMGDLRLSVTDRCNFRCQCCMPAEALPWLERAEVLTLEEIERFVALVASMGVRSVRTEKVLGGEEIRAAIDTVYPLEPEPREPHATARVYRFADGVGRSAIGG